MLFHALHSPSVPLLLISDLVCSLPSLPSHFLAALNLTIAFRYVSKLNSAFAPQVNPSLLYAIAILFFCVSMQFITVAGSHSAFHSTPLQTHSVALPFHCITSHCLAFLCLRVSVLYTSMPLHRHSDLFLRPVVPN